MAFGISVNENITEDQSKKIISIKNKIKRIIAKYGFDDEEWAQAISSQYFLLGISELLQWKKSDYANLLNKCLASFSVTYTGQYILDNNKLLITPDETSHIVKCMKEEDSTDNYYTRSAKMRAENIDSQQMYLNFHYGLLIRIVSSEDTEVLRAIKHTCLDCLLSEQAIDSSDGWYPYRVPWITARVLISLKSVDFSTYQNGDKVQNIITNAISSLFQRIDEKAPFWRSGVGDWVSQWESTALCIEAIYTWDAISNKKDEIRKVIEYVCMSSNKDVWLDNTFGFESEEAANETLASVILASVVLRVTKDYYSDIYANIHGEIFNYFDNVITVILKQDIKKVRQYCTIPQILYYILIAFE